MRTMTIDIETYSAADIKRGVHKYVSSPSFDILLLSYAFDAGEVRTIDLASGEKISERVMHALFSTDVKKTAYNASFEMVCLGRYLHRRIDLSQWECDMVRACYNGYPPGLGVTAKALGLPEDKQKDARGKRLIQYFCKPCKPTKANGGRTRNLPADAPEDWEVFKEYNRQDVVTEMAIRKALTVEVPEKEWRLWRMDQQINDRGIGIDTDLVENAIRINEDESARMLEEARRLTGLENPNSPAQLKKWLAERGYEVASLNKEALADLLKDESLPADVRHVLRLRARLGKTSIKKYEAMADTVTEDGRAHDLFQFYGTHTGRWAGRNIQLQNLARNSMRGLDLARKLVKDGDEDSLAFLYENIPDVLSQLVRTALVPGEGCHFIVADFSAIEARVIAWVAGVKWRQEAFAKGEDIYCASASSMFGVPVVKHGVNGELRQKGKVAELACGYGGGVGALKAFGADKMGLSDEELTAIVERWRAASPEIPKLWHDIEAAAIRCINEGVGWKKGVSVRFSPYGSFSWAAGKHLVMHLPSGRVLVYPNARLGMNRFGSASVLYDGLNQTSRKWGEMETYGGKLTENFIQAIARDCLGAAMLRLEANGYPIVAHIHDEVVIDARKEVVIPTHTLKGAIEVMTRNEPWNEGLLMNANGFTGEYYKKD